MENLPILIVDDEAHIRLTLEETLTTAGYKAEAVGSGEEAITRMENVNFALVLLDLRLPGMDGMAVLRELSRRRPDIPVIVVTAHGNVETAVEAVEIGAAGFIEKPFSPTRVRDAVAQALDKRQQAKTIGLSYDEHLVQAMAALQEGHLGAMIEHARHAIALDASRPEAFNLMGVAMQVRGHLAEARRYYQSALAVDSGYLPAQKNRENLANPPEDRNLSVYFLE